MPDREAFPCLSHAYDAIRQGGTMPCVLNAANEIAVHAFIEKKIGFTDIPVLIEKTMDSHDVQSAAVLGDVFEADRWAREKTDHLTSKRSLQYEHDKEEHREGRKESRQESCEESCEKENCEEITSDTGFPGRFPAR